MGNTTTKSKDDTTIVTESVSEITKEVSSKCEASANSSQTTGKITVNGTGSNGLKADLRIYQKLEQSLQAGCVSSNDLETQLKSQLASTIEKNLKNKVDQSGIKSSGELTSITTQITSIKEKTSFKSLSECIANSAQQQTTEDIELLFDKSTNGNVKVDIEQVLASALSSSCTSKNEDLTKLDKDITTLFKTEQTNDQSGLITAFNNLVDGIVDLYTSAVQTFGMIGVVAIIAVILVGPIFFKMFLSLKSSFNPFSSSRGNDVDKPPTRQNSFRVDPRRNSFRVDPRQNSFRGNLRRNSFRGDLRQIAPLHMYHLS